MRGDSFLEIGDWVVEKILALRGKTANFLAKSVVFAGVALCVEPFWEPYLAAWFESKTGLSIEIEGAPWIGLLLVFMGLAYHYVSVKYQHGELVFKSEQKKVHDSEIIENLERIASAREVRSILNWISNNDAFFQSQRDTLREAAYFLSEPENEFLDAELQQSANNFAKDLGELLNFTALNFFVYPDFKLGSEDEHQFCLYPDHNVDRKGLGTKEQMAFYDEQSRLLDKLVSKAESSQKHLIRSLKERLNFYPSSNP